jgi:hypothetical protein
VPKPFGVSYRFLATTLLAHCPTFAWACLVDDATHFRISEAPSKIAGAAILTVLTLLGITYALRWSARRVRPNISPRVSSALYVTSATIATFLAIGLGLFGSVALPKYQELFAQWGTEETVLVSLVFVGRHLLWLGLAATLYFVWTSRHTKVLSKMTYVAFANVTIFVLTYGVVMSQEFSLC